MRARLALVVLALSALAPLACEGVPDLHFASADSGGPSTDAGAEVSDDSGSVRPDAGVDSGQASPGADAAAGHDSSSAPVTDATAPQSCPNDPPAGTTCCGTTVCKGNVEECQCGLCGMCTAQGFCCPGIMGRYATCATSLDGCPNGGF